jgi:poly(3-hydroxybutyrate) depolymerase
MSSRLPAGRSRPRLAPGIAPPGLSTGLSLGLSLLAWLSGCAAGGAPDNHGAAGASGSGAAGASGSGAGGGASGHGAAGAGGTSASGGTSGASGAGAAGSAGAGSAGASGSGAAGASDGGTSPPDAGAHVMPSAGCNKPTVQALTTFVKHDEMIAASALVTTKWQPRSYFVWLPANYNPSHAYPTVFVGPGCDGTGDNAIPIQNASGNDAIVVGLEPDPPAENRRCFNSESYPDPEVPYFDTTLQAIENDYCVDKSRLFIEGFSSGSWMANLIGCVDGGTMRGQANASGCMQGVPSGTCTKPIAYFAAHNDPDPNNSYGCGTSNRDRILALNGCSKTSVPYDPGPDVKAPTGVTISCVQYMGCMAGFPAVFCTTKGLGHNDQVGTGLSTFGAWRFWMSLP